MSLISKQHVRTFSSPTAQCSRHRLQTCVVKASKAKGFGAPKDTHAGDKKNNKPNIDGSDPSKALKQAIQKVEGRRTAPPVDPAEAAKGKVTFAEVKDWGSGDRSKLGELKVKGLTEGYSGGDGHAFHQQLVQHIEMAQSRGLMKVAQGSKPLPDFKLWSFRAPRYMQYLADMRHVHTAVEQALALVAAAPALPAPHGSVISALALFSPALGLDRSSALLHDMLILAARPSASSPTTPSTTTATATTVTATAATPVALASAPPLPTAGPLAKSLSQAMMKLGQVCSQRGGDVEEREAAGARLMAHVYATHLGHLSGGMRVGATATEKLELLCDGAVSSWRDWPDQVGDPQRLLHDTMDQVGLLLNQRQRDVLLEELIRAVQQNALLLTALAHEN